MLIALTVFVLTFCLDATLWHLAGGENGGKARCDITVFLVREAESADAPHPEAVLSPVGLAVWGSLNLLYGLAVAGVASRFFCFRHHMAVTVGSVSVVSSLFLLTVHPAFLPITGPSAARLLSSYVPPLRRIYTEFGFNDLAEWIVVVHSLIILGCLVVLGRVGVCGVVTRTSEEPGTGEDG